MVSDFEQDVKSYLRMASNVTVFDEEIRGLIAAAISSLKVAGIAVTPTAALVREYIRTYVRLRMLQDTSEAFRNSEKERELHLIQQLVYGVE